jgi:NAD(P)H-hydrate epimerase
VLTGILAGLVAQYAKNPNVKQLSEVADFGVYLHGLAGDLAYEANGEAPIIASDLIEFLPRAYHHFYSEIGRV